MLQRYQGAYDEAILSFQKAIAILGYMPWVNELMGWALVQSGHEEKARKILRESKKLSQQSYVPSSAFLLLHIGLGEKCEALVWLLRVFNERDVLLQWIKGLPEFDPLRSSSEFRRVLHSMRLDEHARNGRSAGASAWRYGSHKYYNVSPISAWELRKAIRGGTYI